MGHRAEPTVRLSDAPPTPAEELAKACAAADLKAFKDNGHDVDSVRVFAFKAGRIVASWIAIKPGEGG